MRAPALTDRLARQYDEIQRVLDRLGGPTQYMNYGYSIRGSADGYVANQERLCRLVFDAAGIGADDVLVDVGFGSGEQDVLLARTYRFRRLDGFNIAAAQVEHARRRAHEAGLDGRLVFHAGPAEDLGRIADGAVDAVLAVECAFHFDRPRFYAEAARVLRPGGRLVMADITLRDSLNALTRAGEAARRLASRSGNRRAWEAHFTTRLVRPLNAHVVKGAQRTVSLILGTILRHFHPSETRTWAMLLKMAWLSQLSAAGLWLRLLHYDLVVLERR